MDEGELSEIFTLRQSKDEFMHRSRAIRQYKLKYPNLSSLCNVLLKPIIVVLTIIKWDFESNYSNNIPFRSGSIYSVTNSLYLRENLFLKCKGHKILKYQKLQAEWNLQFYFSLVLCKFCIFRRNFRSWHDFNDIRWVESAAYTAGEYWKGKNFKSSVLSCTISALYPPTKSN